MTTTTPLAMALWLAGGAGGAAQQEPAREGESLYRVWTVRAAPGELLELIDRLRERLPVWTEALGSRPLIVRHSQGDQWDLMVLFSWRSFTRHFGEESAAARTAERAFERTLEPLISWQQDWWALGVPPEVLAQRAVGAGFFHLEAFQALPGRREMLLEQRRMENDYLRRIGRQQNLIFRRVAGAPWDALTIGFYRDLKEFAESVDVPPDREEAAARAAGFEGAGFIGAYLRSLIAEHHDTLAVAVPAR